MALAQSTLVSSQLIQRGEQTQGLLREEGNQ